MRRFFTIVLCGFYLFGVLPSSKIYAQQSPSYLKDASKNEEESQGLLDWIYDHTPSKGSGYILSIENLCLELLQHAWESANKIREVMQKEGRAIALSLLLPVLTAEITFTGVRMMLRASIVEQLGRLTLTTFLLTVLLWPNGPTDIIANGMQQLALAGKGIGKKILVAAIDPQVTQHLLPSKTKFGWDQMKNANINADDKKALAGIEDITQYNPSKKFEVGPKELEPIYYWTAWIGIPPTREELKEANQKIDAAKDPASKPYNPSGDPNRFYKFSISGLMLRIWADPQYASSKSGPIAPPDSLDLETKVILACIPFQQLTAALMIAGVQVGAIIAPAFSMITILVGSIFSFHIVYALGIATLPLIYFRSFDKLWSKYLTLLAGFALVPFFYYIFSAIGFVFTVNIFEALFPLDPAPGSTSLAQLINNVFMSSIYSALSGSIYFDNSLFHSALSAVYSLGQGFIVLGKITAASVVVASFIFGGTSFAAMAPTVALRWSMGFGGHEMMGKISDFFQGLGMTMSGAVGSVVGEQIERTGGRLRGLGKGNDSPMRG